MERDIYRNINNMFNEIAKDIRNRQDNTMAMEFTKCIGELLKKNGVVPKITEYTRNFATENTFETRYGVSVDELDFTEHNKVFEDKIASLEEKIGYYKDSISRVEKNCDKLYHENKELKQRIAELEGNETSVPKKIRIESDGRITEIWIDGGKVNPAAFEGLNVCAEPGEIYFELEKYVLDDSDKPLFDQTKNNFVRETIRIGLGEGHSFLDCYIKHRIGETIAFLESEIKICDKRFEVQSPYYDGVDVGFDNAQKLNTNHINFCKKLLEALDPW